MNIHEKAAKFRELECELKAFKKTEIPGGTIVKVLGHGNTPDDEYGITRTGDHDCPLDKVWVLFLKPRMAGLIPLEHCTAETDYSKVPAAVLRMAGVNVDEE